MRILQISNSFKPAWEAGGTTRVVYDISCGLKSRGHDVTVYTTDRGQKRVEAKKNRPVRVDNLIVYYFSNISNYIAMKLNIVTPYYLFFIARKHVKDFDIIHIHEHRTFLAVIVSYYAKKYNIPYIVQAHGSVMPFYQKTLFKKIFDKFWGNNILNNASNLIALTDIESKQYKKMGITEDRITIIPNGINVSDYQNLPKKGEFRKEYNIKLDEKIILYLGRIHKRKGIEILLDAFFEILNELNPVKLVIVGPDDGFLKTIENQAKALKIDVKILITGPLFDEEKRKAYTDADLLVYPAIHEIFGLVPFEAILCNTPVVVTKNDGCGELIEKINCGYLVEYGDTKSLIDTISYVLKNLDKQSTFIENGKKYISNDLNWEKISKEVEKVYENCIRNI